MRMIKKEQTNYRSRERHTHGVKRDNNKEKKEKCMVYKQKYQ